MGPLDLWRDLGEMTRAIMIAVMKRYVTDTPSGGRTCAYTIL